MSFFMVMVIFLIIMMVLYNIIYIYLSTCIYIYRYIHLYMYKYIYTDIYIAVCGQSGQCQVEHQYYTSYIHVILVLGSVRMLNCVYWFVLPSWHEFILKVYGLLSVLLNSICKHFLKGFWNYVL
jgi:hypothetical protein